MIANRLYNEAKKHFGVCVGLDTDISYVPNCIAKKDISNGEKIFEFNKAIIDAVSEESACFKVQIAYYEALGLEGLSAYAQTLKYIKAKGKISIADIKRGDISATAKKYADAHFTGDFEADYVTLNAYMGEDAISPYYDYFKNRDKGAFVLVKTSNPSGVDFQDIKVSDARLYEMVGEKLNEWGKQFTDESGYSSIGAVVGLTYPEEFISLLPKMDSTFFLIPGYGAQGGTGEDIAKIFKNDFCGVVNSSRGIIASHIKNNIDEGFAQEALTKVKLMKEDISKWL